MSTDGSLAGNAGGCGEPLHPGQRRGDHLLCGASRTAAVRLASYNIHAAVGTDGRRDVERIAAVIQQIDPDIIALQEVESRRARGGIDQAKVLASALDMYCVEGPILEDGVGWYGNAILSRWPGNHVEHLRYPVHSGEPRAALGARIADGSGHVWRIVATHLDLRLRYRWRQVQTLVGTFATAPPASLAVLADLNEWWPWAPTWHALRAFGEVSASIGTFPSWCPLLPLDRMVLRHCSPLGAPRRHASALSRRASDHLPVVVEVIPAAAGPPDRFEIEASRGAASGAPGLASRL